MVLKIPSFTAALTAPVPLSPKWGGKEMTQEISIHQVRADWVAGAQEGADPTVLSGPSPYILSCSPPALLDSCSVDSPIQRALSLFTVT